VVPEPAVGHDEAPTTWSKLLDDATSRLATGDGSSAPREARWLIEEVSGLDAAELIVERDRPVSQTSVARLADLLDRRLAGEPIQYVLGRWSFRTLDLFVDPRVLIPRPETETVVDHALAAVDRTSSAPAGGEGSVRVVDLGTGSGAIALAVAAERTNTEVWATDSSSAALAVARANLAGLGRPARRVHLAAGDWFDALPDDLQGSVDLVVSNPPYIGDGEALPDGVAHWEPVEALRAGPTGFEALELIVDRSGEWLSPGGSVVLEMAPTQGEALRSRATRAGYLASVEPDLVGRDRVLVATRSD
jgi:release factor glutamine methyltransferase